MSVNLRTPKVRFSYAHVFEPKAVDDGKPQYSVCLLIPKSDKEGLKSIGKAILEAAIEGKAKFSKKAQQYLEQGKLPPASLFKMPLRDGDERDGEEFEGCYFFNANSKNRKPQVVHKKEGALEFIVDDPDEFYSGCYGQATVAFYAFSTSGNTGVACGLNNIIKLEEGGRLSGGSTALEDFQDVESPGGKDEPEDDFLSMLGAEEDNTV